MGILIKPAKKEQGISTARSEASEAFLSPLAQ
jgi:hypothetical protein